MIKQMTLTALGGGLVVLLALSILQRKLIYFPSHEDRTGRGTEVFEPLRDEGGALLGYVRKADRPLRVVLFFHGNGGEALHRDWIGSILPQETITVVLAEYPGYGGSTGSPSEAAIQKASLDLYDLVASRWQVPATLMGESLGTAVASFVAAHRSAERLALISPFTSLAEVGRTHYPFLPVSLLLSEHYDSMAQLAQVTIPLKVIHGMQDEIVPLELGRRLFEAYPGADKAFIELPNVGHNDIALPIVRDDQAAPFRDFITGDKS